MPLPTSWKPSTCRPCRVSSLSCSCSLSGPAPQPLPFTIDKPARIALDLPNTALALASRRIDVRNGGVDTVLAAEANGRTRLVVNVDHAAALQDPGRRQQHHRHARRSAAGAAPAAAAAAPLRRRRAAATASAAIRTIDFRRGSDGTGRVIVQLTDPRTPVNVRQEGNQVVVDFAGTRLPKNLHAPLRRHGLRDAGADLSMRCASRAARAW